MPVDYAGNTLGTARELTITPSSQTFTDWVGSLDTNDSYRFSLGGHSSFNLKLDDISANADVQLLNSSGTVIASSILGNTGAEYVNQALDAGTYYIRVFPYGNANTYYNLTVSATPVDYAGNTISTARNIPIGSSPSTYRDWVGSVDTNDYYNFTLSNTSNVQLAVNGLIADADVQLLRLNTDGTTTKIASSAASGITAEAINVSSLAAGNYLAWVYQYSGDTFYNLSVSATSPQSAGNNTQDWFSQNLKDSKISNLTRSLATDGELSRNDMIAIFRESEDGNLIDATELTDLRMIASNGSLLGMQDYVRVLSNKIVNGDPANQTYQGTTLGNLYVGSRATQMENLISKWFLGNDRPSALLSNGTAAYGYRKASGSLFQNGISYQDVKQGDANDCYFLSALAETAFRSASTIQSMFIDNGDDTFTVRFYKNGVSDYVTVDKYLPINSSGRFINANTGDAYNNPSNELWVALAEKAYAQLNESGWIGQDNTNSYLGLSGGWDGDALNHITGLSSNYDKLDFNKMVSAFTAKSYMAVSSKVTGAASNVVSNHSYVVVGYNASTQKFSLFNPWGVNGGTDKGVVKPGTLQMSFSELVASFEGWSYTTA
jgi:hypothetical protein